MHDDVPQTVAVLIPAREVSQLLGCSARHVQRLCDAGRMPPPVRLGVLVRWSRAVIDQWIADGCPEPRKYSTHKNRANAT